MRGNTQGIIKKGFYKPIKTPRINGTCKFCLCYTTEDDNSKTLCKHCYKELGSGA